MEPLVSVICVTRNHERFCIESLDSVLNQTYKNIEWIILDAASDDSTVVLIDNWLVDNNVDAIFLKEKELKPITVNLNKALTHAHGEYVQFLSLDDVLLREKIKVQVNLIQMGKYDSVFCNSMTIDDTGKDIKIYRQHAYLKELDAETFLKEIKKNCFVLVQSCLIPFDTIKKVGIFDEDLIIEDWDWLIRFWNYKFSLTAKYDETTNTLYRTIEGSLWFRRNYQLFVSHFNIIKKHKLFLNKNTLVNSLQLFRKHNILSLNIFLYFLCEFKMISMAVFYLTNNLKLFNFIYKVELKFKKK